MLSQWTLFADPVDVQGDIRRRSSALTGGEPVNVNVEAISSSLHAHIPIPRANCSGPLQTQAALAPEILSNCVSKAFLKSTKARETPLKADKMNDDSRRAQKGICTVFPGDSYLLL